MHFWVTQLFITITEYPKTSYLEERSSGSVHSPEGSGPSTGGSIDLTIGYDVFAGGYHGKWNVAYEQVMGCGLSLGQVQAPVANSLQKHLLRTHVQQPWYSSRRCHLSAPKLDSISIFWVPLTHDLRVKYVHSKGTAFYSNYSRYFLRLACGKLQRENVLSIC